MIIYLLNVHAGIYVKPSRKSVWNKQITDDLKWIEDWIPSTFGQGEDFMVSTYKAVRYKQTSR